MLYIFFSPSGNRSTKSIPLKRKEKSNGIGMAIECYAATETDNTMNSALEIFERYDDRSSLSK